MGCFVLIFATRKQGPAHAAALHDFHECVRGEFSNCWNNLEGTSIVIANATADGIRDRLNGCLKDGAILVARICEDVAWTGLTSEDTEWLVNRL